MICPNCGSEKVTSKLYKEKASSNTVSKTKSKYKEKGHGWLWWLTIGWWWWIVDLFIWIVAFVPRLAIQLSKNKKYESESVRVSQTNNNTVYKGVCMCNDCGHTWVASSASDKAADAAASDDTPFYKKTWFLIASGVIFPPLGILLVWTIYKDWDIKKKSIATAVMALWFIIIICSGGSTPDAEPLPSSSDIVSAADVKLSITLIEGELGEYGVSRTLNEGTEDAYTFIEYHLPAGTYKVTNVRDEYLCVLYVYGNEYVVNDAGFEEPKEITESLKLESGQSGTFTLGEDQHIKISQNSIVTIEEQ